MELLIIIGLVLLNGIFSMSEMALVSARKFKLEKARNLGSQGAKTALELSGNPTRFFSTVQIGITLIGVLLGIYSGENLTGGVEAFLARIEWLQPYASNLAVGMVVIFVTYLSIVLGELLPKKLGLSFPEAIITLLARPMYVLSRITAPFVWLLTITNDLLLRLLGIKTLADGNVSEEEIKSIVRESAVGGEILDIEQNIVERVFELGDRKVNALMTHRTNLVYFDEQDSLEDIRQIIRADKHSAYPVCAGGDIDKITGIVLLKDLFDPMLETPFSLKNHLRKPLYMTESMLAYKLLESFKKEGLHYAIVVDEFGATRGMVTMDDVLDALVGDVSANNQSENQIVVRADNTWFVDGQYSASEFFKYFGLVAEEGSDDAYVTVAGLFISKFNALPNVGDTIHFQALILEVVDKDGQRIDKILVRRA